MGNNTIVTPSNNFLGVVFFCIAFLHMIDFIGYISNQITFLKKYNIQKFCKSLLCSCFLHV